MDVLSLKGKKVLVTGGTRGIGRAISLQFARAGATVIANYLRNEDTAKALMAEADKDNLDLLICRADLSRPKGMERLIEFVDSQFTSISALIHCAATGVHRPFTQLELRQFDFVYNLNVRAFFDLVQRCIEKFDKDGASILSISSEGAARAVPDYSLVGSSKAAMESLSRHMAVELAPRNIRVNIISAGSVATDVWNVMPNAEQRLKETIDRSPIGRLITADEVAYAALFLCSDAARGIIGQTLIVDGGLRILS